MPAMTDPPERTVTRVALHGGPLDGSEAPVWDPLPERLEFLAAPHGAYLRRRRGSRLDYDWLGDEAPTR